MSVYISAELRRRVRKHFSDACAYCQTSEALTVTIFEIEHIIPRAADGETVFENLCLADLAVVDEATSPLRMP